MATLDPLPTFAAPATTERPCLEKGNTYTRCQSQCPFLAHDGTLKPGCIFYPRSNGAGYTRTKEQYAKYSKPKAQRTEEEVVPGFQVWEIEQG